MDTKPQDQMKRSLREAFRYRGCPICHVVGQEEADFMATLQYQTFNEEKVRQEVVSENGYCNFHFHQMARMASPVGVALLAKELIHREIREIETGSFDTVLGIDCRICRYTEEIEAWYVRGFKRLLCEESFQKEYEATDGLCRIHLKKVLDLTEESQLGSVVLSFHGTHLRLLEAELETFILKMKTTRDFGEERDSWWVAIEKRVGRKGLMK